MGASLRRHRDDDERGHQARPRGRQSVGAARSHPDAKRRRDGGNGQPEEGLGEGPLQRPRLQHLEPLRADHPQRVRNRGRRRLQDSLPERRACGARPLRAAHARRGVGLDEGALRVRSAKSGAGRALLESRAVQRAHQRAPQHRHSRRLLRAGGRRDEPQERALQLGQRRVARARPRLRDPAVEEPRAALVHRGAQRIRDDCPASGVATRARP